MIAAAHLVYAGVMAVTTSRTYAIEKARLLAAVGSPLIAGAGRGHRPASPPSGCCPTRPPTRSAPWRSAAPRSWGR